MLSVEVPIVLYQAIAAKTPAVIASFLASEFRQQPVFSNNTVCLKVSFMML